MLPHAELCPEGAIIKASYGQSLCDALLHGGIEIEHAYEMACACSTCHVIVREGYDSLNPTDDAEDDMLGVCRTFRRWIDPELCGVVCYFR